MGNRVKGRVKKKSIRAASHSGMGSKRKLSRFGKKQKKNHSGLDATFIGRSACLKRLQVTLKDFRRLCILKGVYPREPRGRTPSKKKGQVYYHIKDLKSLAHEPILAKFREFRAFMRKVRRAAGRNEGEEARRMEGYAPSYSLHHLVKERYPRFGDALGDLDDALALVYLYAALPSKGRVSSKVTRKAQTLAARWGAFCATTGALTKTFVSVKGVYMEAELQAVSVRWVIPHPFTQDMPTDVDYRVMNTFFEFYETLLGFVLFRLYADIGVQYPPRVTDVDVGCATSALLANIAWLRTATAGDTGRATAIQAVQEGMRLQDAPSVSASAANHGKASTQQRKLLNTVGSALDRLTQDDSSDDEDAHDAGDLDIATPLLAALDSNIASNDDPTSSIQLSASAVKRRTLFRNLTIFLSREMPKGYLELIALSYGARTVGWEGTDSPISVSDPSITHHIVDRPKASAKQYENLPKSREFVQPQWLLDCANFDVLLPVGRYGLGEELPPHLSPWVDDVAEGYVPKYKEEIERFKNDGFMEVVASKGTGMEDNSDEEDGALVAQPDLKIEKEDSSSSSSDGDDDNEDSASEEDEDEDEAKTREKIEAQKEKTANEEKLLARGMMSKKASRLYGRMQHGIAKKQATVDTLQRKRKEIEHKKGKTADGKTIFKAKVERLKDERRSIEKDYEEGKGSTTRKNKRKKKRVL